MSHRRQPSSLLSSKVLSYLNHQGYRQREVARMLGVTEGFISLVKSQQRSLTLDHLEALAEVQDTPLGEFLIEVTRPKKMKPKSAEVFASTERIMRKTDAAIAALRGRTVKKRPRVA
ncbi:MAG TPA: helix-turn-helix transcriptional regulator [Tepidisphaeraceae bacterium]|nr:helix-turn-helix transcriptional regulator [Tepidisphaeraceae bacterium]